MQRFETEEASTDSSLVQSQMHPIQYYTIREAPTKKKSCFQVSSSSYNCFPLIESVANNAIAHANYMKNHMRQFSYRWGRIRDLKGRRVLLLSWRTVGLYILKERGKFPDIFDFHQDWVTSKSPSQKVMECLRKSGSASAGAEHSLHHLLLVFLVLILSLLFVLIFLFVY